MSYHCFYFLLPKLELFAFLQWYTEVQCLNNDNLNGYSVEEISKSLDMLLAF